MPDQATTPQANPYDEARAKLHFDLWRPVFFAKLASFNIHPQNEEEALEYEKMAFYADQIEQSGNAKQASDRTSWLKGVNQKLAGVVGVEENLNSKQAADRLLGDEMFRASALLVHDSLAAQASA